MTITVAILAHDNLNRVAHIVKYFSNFDIRVAVHIDAKVDNKRVIKFKESLAEVPDILWAKQVECEWGDFSLVQATLNMAKESLDKWSDSTHVVLLSGDSIPVRPLDELTSYLDAHPDTDFIESVLVDGNNWVVDGLGIERFTLFFPFSWKSQRWLFDTWVTIQRKLRVKRPVPADLRLHIGSQWWCLSRPTLTAILSDSKRRANDTYFRKCWIPDESYFATLARKHSANIESRSLMFSKFDYQGKPLTFYDDHVEVLAGLNEFFARKIWYGSDLLYQRFTKTRPHIKHRTLTASTTSSDLHKTATRPDREGVRIQHHTPSTHDIKQMSTTAPYHVFTGARAIFPDFDNWLFKQTSVKPLGRLFNREKVEFDETGGNGPGGLSNIAAIRDLAPDAFLCNLVWNTNDTTLGFHFDSSDNQGITNFLTHDPNANIHLIRHSWVIDLMNRKITNVDFLQSTAAKLVQAERTFISKIRALDTTANVTIWTVGEVLSDPNQYLGKVLHDLGGQNLGGPMILPKMSRNNKLVVFGQRLRNSGVAIDISTLEVKSDPRQGSTRVHIHK